MISGVCVLFLVIFATTYAQKGATCVTQNRENGSCISIHTCKPIKQVVAYFNESQCGYNGSVPLVCCGPLGKIISPPDPTVKPALPPASIFVPSYPLPLTHTLLPDSSLCGLQVKQPNMIIGGRATGINEYPWLVALKYKKDNGDPGGIRCSGTLINGRYILTAAQCLSIPGYNLTEVRLGEWRISTEKDCTEDTEDEDSCADPVVDLVITEKLPHPYYSKRSGNNDIALLVVGEKINYTEFVRPICLPPEEFPPPSPGTRMYITGWGITENGTQSDVKLKVDIPMVSNSDCAKSYPNYARINPNQACAGGEEGKDACNGDSGGPLMRTYEKSDPTDEEQWFQEGIIYRGLGCGHKGIAGLYTRVSRYTHWIVNNLKVS